MWNYYRDEVNDFASENNDANNFRINNNKTTTSKSFEYKTKLNGSTPNNDNRLDAEVVVPLKYLSNFWRYLNFPLIKCEVELDLSWSRYCAISEISRKSRTPTPEMTTTTNTATFQINNAKIYVPVVTLLINNNIKVLENIKQGFKIIYNFLEQIQIGNNNAIKKQ